MDLIDRQAAIDAMSESLKRVFPEHRQIAEKCLNVLPSAQPKRTGKRTETHACDLISRQAAIDALTRKMVSIPTAGEKDLMGDVNRIRAEDISVIRRLPSVQPEMIREIRKWINSGNRGNADYFIVEKIEEIINKYE